MWLTPATPVRTLLGHFDNLTPDHFGQLVVLRLRDRLAVLLEEELLRVEFIARSSLHGNSGPRRGVGIPRNPRNALGPPKVDEVGCQCRLCRVAIGIDEYFQHDIANPSVLDIEVVPEQIAANSIF